MKASLVAAWLLPCRPALRSTPHRRIARRRLLQLPAARQEPCRYGHRFNRRPAGLAALAAGFLAIVSAAVFFLQTRNGTIRVQIDDPEIEVSIKGTEIKFTKADSQVITVKPGEEDKTFIVRRGPDFEFTTDKLTSRRATGPSSRWNWSTAKCAYTATANLSVLRSCRRSMASARLAGRCSASGHRAIQRRAG